MNESELKKIFSEFINLSYTPSKTRFFRDFKISECIICREDENGYTIIYLYNGTRFNIPWEISDIFSSFNVYLGSRIEYLSKNSKDNIDNTIRLLTQLFIYLGNRLHNVQGQEVLDILGELSLLSTEDFRDWYNKEFKIELKPLRFLSLLNDIEI